MIKNDILILRMKAIKQLKNSTSKSIMNSIYVSLLV